MGTFLPIFRSHGTDTPREIWNFGEKGSIFYDAIDKFICLPYKLMPYIYSMAYAVCRHGETIMRSLLFDFIDDPAVKTIHDQFMFGKSFLICPVTEPMYYDSGNNKIEKPQIRKCYLPKGYDWYDYWTGVCYEGGNWITSPAPIDRIPVFVREESIVPTVEGLQYACQKPEHPMVIHIYPGKNASFVLYEDEGDSYNFEKGLFSLIPIEWDEKQQLLTLHNRSGEFPGMENKRTFILILGSVKRTASYDGDEMEISFK